MKAEIKMDSVSKCGILKITAETGTEAYALSKWHQSFNFSGGESMLCVETELPALVEGQR